MLSGTLVLLRRHSLNQIERCVPRFGFIQEILQEGGYRVKMGTRFVTRTAEMLEPLTEDVTDRREQLRVVTRMSSDMTSWEDVVKGVVGHKAVGKEGSYLLQRVDGGTVWVKEGDVPPNSPDMGAGIPRPVGVTGQGGGRRRRDGVDRRAL